MRGLSITGEIKVFKNEYGYSTTISNKDLNGNWDKMYIGIQLPKGQDVENEAVILITKGFMSFYKDKNGYAKPKVVVMEFIPVGQENIEQCADDLPF